MYWPYFVMAPVVSDFTEDCRLKPKTPPPALLQGQGLVEALGIMECLAPCAVWTEFMPVPLPALSQGSEYILVYSCVLHSLGLFLLPLNRSAFSVYLSDNW